MTETTRENDGELLARMGTDAEKWAAELSARLLRDFDAHVQDGCCSIRDLVRTMLNPDGGSTLAGWLCGAIGAGETAGAARAHREFASSLPFMVKLHAADEWAKICSEPSS